MAWLLFVYVYEYENGMTRSM